jgi:hypothetical protein
MKKTVLMAALAVSLVGCASVQDSNALNEMITAADQEIAMAKKANVNLWDSTVDILKEAKAAQEVALSDKADALKKAKKALMEAKLAQKQAQDNANAAPYYLNN